MYLLNDIPHVYYYQYIMYVNSLYYLSLEPVGLIHVTGS